MKLIPAIDLKDNKCVRLSEGKENSSQIFNENPIEQAKYFEDLGCPRVHIVDLDAAFGRKDINKKTIIKIRENTSFDIELGGGIRSKKEIDFWIENKINYLIVGSFASTHPKKTQEICNKYPDKIYIALDYLNDDVMIKGWKERSKKNIMELFSFFNNIRIKGFIVTDISRDGLLLGININKVSEYLSFSEKPIIVGGGLASYEDIKILLDLKSRKLEGVIAGKSFYLGLIDILKGQEIMDDYA